MALLWSAAAPAQTFAPLSGRVVDGANLLDPQQEAALTGKLTAIETQTGRQFVVATVPDLQGYEIDEFGYKLGRAWGIGRKRENDGVILLVAPTERKVRIEVGYGLEPYLTDALSSVIIQTQVLPRFRAGDMPGGVIAGADAVIAQLRLPEDEAQARQQQLLAAQRTKGDDGIPIAMIFWIVVLLFIILPMILGKSRGKRHRGGAWPVVIWGGGGGGGGGWGGGGGGGFSGGGGSFGGGGASGGW